jgi:hypothetical protein
VEWADLRPQLQCHEGEWRVLPGSAPQERSQLGACKFVPCLKTCVENKWNFFMKVWCYYSQVVIELSMYVKVMWGMNLGLTQL